MVTFKLNGKEVQGEEGQYIIEIAEKNGVKIPTLCNHKALEPAGMCRICTVEMFDGRRTKYVTACNYPIWEGMEVSTDTETIVEGRKLIVEFLLSRCPDVPLIQELAEEYGLEKPRFSEEDSQCILCGLCTRVCERMGNSAITLTGRGLNLDIGTPFSVKTDTCKGCGACAFVCPTGRITLDVVREKFSIHDIKEIPSEYDLGLSGRKPIYVPYAQAIPNTPAIDRSVCVHYRTGGCKICADICPVDAIDHSTDDEIVEIEVGAIIAAPGFKPFDPADSDTYGYSKHPNVMTSLEFERMLSASGPFQGHVVRPSDHKEPTKIAWLQCAGSRDNHPGSGKYCSAVCCTYAVKEAVMAKDHVAGLDTAVFYIDIRTQGKDFETYYNNARDKSGVRFIKSKITKLDHVEETDMMRLAYTEPSGMRKIEDFDIVVLSIGLCVPDENIELFNKLGIDLDEDKFPVTNSFNPVESSKPGIFVCGAAHSPQDIPSSVVNASAAAGVAAKDLASSRWTMTKTKELPVEKDLRGEPPRVGVFVCKCGTNIAGVVDVEGVVEYAEGLPNVTYATHKLFACSQDAQDQISEAIKSENLNRIVVAACTPRTHEAIFQETLVNAGLNKYLFDMANIRNHCSWVHASKPDSATDKSKDLVRMTAQKVTQLAPLQEYELEVNQKALIIGGGLSGLTAAVTLAGQGFETSVVETSGSLGGQAKDLSSTWMGEDMGSRLQAIIKQAENDEKINIYLNAEMTNVSGSVGKFKTTITQDGQETEISHGVAVIATGGVEYKPAEHLYGTSTSVMTGMELERKLIEKDQSLSAAGSAVFLQCVGSRIPERPYCSKVCCTQSVSNALKLKELNPDMEVYVVYRDMRTYGLRESLYQKARIAGVRFVRYDLDKGLDVADNNGKLTIGFVDNVLGRRLEIEADKLILASAIIPPEKTDLPTMFKVPVNDDGFYIEAHVKLRPVDFATDGVFVCGLAHGPKPVDEAVSQAQAAAARAAGILSAPRLSIDGVIGTIDFAKCTGCGVCAAVCPYSAITLAEEGRDIGKPMINPAMCKGCGNCSASCRSGAASLLGFDNAAIFDQIDAF